MDKIVEIDVDIDYGTRMYAEIMDITEAYYDKMNVQEQLGVLLLCQQTLINNECEL